MKLQQTPKGLWQVVLNRNEYFRGARAGFVHCANNICADRKDRMGFNSYDSHIFGSVGEYAFAMALGSEWLGEREGHFNRPDVAPNWQVRWAREKNLRFGLTYKTTDMDSWSLVLTSGDSDIITIYGWIPADFYTLDAIAFERSGKSSLKEAGYKKGYSIAVNELWPFEIFNGSLVPTQKLARA